MGRRHARSRGFRLFQAYATFCLLFCSHSAQALGAKKDHVTSEELAAQQANIIDQNSVQILLQTVAKSAFLAGAESKCNMRKALTIKGCTSLVIAKWSTITGVKISHPDDATKLATSVWENALADGENKMSSSNGCPDVDAEAEKLDIISICQSAKTNSANGHPFYGGTLETPGTPSDTSPDGNPAGGDPGNHVISEEMSIQ